MTILIVFLSCLVLLVVVPLLWARRVIERRATQRLERWASDLGFECAPGESDAEMRHRILKWLKGPVPNVVGMAFYDGSGTGVPPHSVEVTVKGGDEP
jgi:hypothetical protein